MPGKALRYAILDDRVTYTGRELRSGWAMERTGFDGDAAVVFLGPCHVATEDLVDMDDAREGASIHAAIMAHVIIEHRDCDLRAAVLRQRLLVCILREALEERGCAVRRDGDDLFYHDRKLTVSIAAPAAGSCLIHLGINVDASGAPVAAVDLSELGVAPAELARSVMDRYASELSTATHAETKVRQVD